MDMLRFQKFTIGWAWVSDYGSSDDPEQFKALYAYSPYHNLRRARRYPPTLVTTGDHDDRVVPGHSFKFAAALQAAQADDAPVLIRIQTKAGHGMGKPTSVLIQETADMLAFLVRVLGMDSGVVASVARAHCFTTRSSAQNLSPGVKHARDSREQPGLPVNRAGKSRCWPISRKGTSRLPADVPPDAGADYDYIETIDLIRAALETGGHETVFIQADANLPFALKEARPDICFNIAEGLGGDAREAQVPALLELLKIPYTGSRIMANAISLDKTLTKRIWRDRRLPVAPFQEFIVGDESLRPGTALSAVRQARPGGHRHGRGHERHRRERDRAARAGGLHHQHVPPAGAGGDVPFRPRVHRGHDRALGLRRYSRHPEWYDEKNGYHVFPVLELDSSRSVTPLVYSQAAKSASVGDEGAPGYICPADIEPELAKKLQALAVKAHQALKAIDVSRTDIRLNAEGQPFLLETNTLPGLTPGYSDLCLEAAAEGISYEDLILEILQLGASRWGLVSPRQV